MCVVEARSGEPAYDRLDECDVEVTAVLPWLGVELPLRGHFDLILVGCTEALLGSPIFQRRLAQVADHIRVVGIASRPTPDLAAHAARIGFHGFLAKEVDPQAFDRAVAAVLSGELAFPRTAMSALIRLVRRTYRRLPRFRAGELTPRQLQIVNLIASGANDREIADALHISPSTVHKHVQNALRRTNTRTRSHLAAALGQPT